MVLSAFDSSIFLNPTGLQLSEESSLLVSFWLESLVQPGSGPPDHAAVRLRLPLPQRSHQPEPTNGRALHVTGRCRFRLKLSSLLPVNPDGVNDKPVSFLIVALTNLEDVENATKAYEQAVMMDEWVHCTCFPSNVEFLTLWVSLISSIFSCVPVPTLWSTWTLPYSSIIMAKRRKLWLSTRRWRGKSTYCETATATLSLTLRFLFSLICKTESIHLCLHDLLHWSPLS